MKKIFFIFVCDSLCVLHSLSFKIMPLIPLELDDVKLNKSKWNRMRVFDGISKSKAY